MFLPENDYQILRLTDLFYQDYPHSRYGEIMIKKNRAYNCLLFQTHYDYFICIPYRTEIVHDNAYRFKYSKRSEKHRSGLDYSKIIIITETKYLDNKDAIIDKDEFKETIRNIEKIKNQALQYVENYVAHMRKSRLLHPEEFKRRYQYSTLQYFHKELKINTIL